MKNTIFFILMTAMLLIGVFSSCNPQRKIQKAERVLKDNNALAKICADEFPVKEIYIKGDSVLTLDTLYIGGEVVYDTVETKDTVTITITKTLPAKVITKTILVTDTVVKENTARVADLTNIVNKKDTEIAVLQADRDNWKAKAKQRFWWLMVLAGAVGAYILLKVKKIISF